MPVSPYPVSASAAYYFDPAEDARRIAAIQARIQAGIAAERAANQARSQRRSRSGGGRSRGGSRDARTYASNSGMKYPEEPAITMRPQYDPEEYASNSGMTYPARGPVSPAEAAYAAEDRMQPRYLGVSAGPAVSAYDQALTNNGGVSEQWYTQEPVAPAPVSQPAPPPVVTPEQAVAASEGMMQPRYLNMRTAPAAYSQDQALIANGGMPEQGYTSLPPYQALVNNGVATDPGYPVPPTPAPYVAPDSALSDSQALYARVGPQMPDGYTPVPEAPYRGLGFAQSGAPAFNPQLDPAFAPPPPRVVTPEQAAAASEGMMQPRYLNMSVPPAAYSQDQALAANGGVSDLWYTQEPVAPAPAPQPAPQLVVTPEQAVAASEGMMQPRYTGATTAASSGLGALWSMVRSAVADALSGADAGIRRWGEERAANPGTNLWGETPAEPSW